jgi:uncharacterized protein YggT (Ycf19 family)
VLLLVVATVIFFIIVGVSFVDWFVPVRYAYVWNEIYQSILKNIKKERDMSCG